MPITVLSRSALRPTLRTVPRSVRSARISHHDKVTEVIPLLANRLSEELTLSIMAAAAASSRFHFNRFFREVTGIPPCQFLYAMRLAQAKHLLLATRRKVIDICYDVGYQSLGTFTRRFTELVGLSPSRFRLQARRLKEQPALLQQLHYDGARRRAGHSLTGVVAAPVDFDGLIFVALFSGPIPQGKPASCAILNAAGRFLVRDLPEGTFYLFALALTTPLETGGLFHAPYALRAGGERIVVSTGGVHGRTSLVLRPPKPVDPPILLALQSMMLPSQESLPYPVLQTAGSMIAQQSVEIC